MKSNLYPNKPNMHIKCMRSVIMVDARVSLNKYSNQVLEVVKAKYGLKDKSQALNKFIEDYGENELEREVKDSYIKKILKISEEHYKKYGYRHTSIEELKKEVEGE